jgi:LMBR1 domain-containing protein 1
MGVDIILLIFMIVVPLFLAVVALYIFAYFSHSDEQDFAKSWITRIFTMFIILFGMVQQFLIPLDLADHYSDGGLPLEKLFNIYYIVLSVFLFLILPFSTFYYETSEETTTKARLKGAFFKCFVYVCLIITITIGSYFLLDSDDSKNFQVYIIAMFMFFGWLLLFFSLGVGVIALPFDLIYEFIHRPSPMQPAEFDVKKKILLDNLLFLRRRCNETLEERSKIESMRNFRKWWSSARLTRQIASIHVKVLILENEYIKLVKVSKFAKFIEPMVYFFKLVLGIIFILLNI